MSSTGGQWLLTVRTSRFFFASSVVVLAVGCLIVVLATLFQLPAYRELGGSPAIYVPLAAILAPNAICVTFIMVGMLWYWVQFDDSRRLVKILWLGSFIALGWYSTSVYYFVVYRRQRRLAGDVRK
ncbi:MAG TPA: hypothetical protein VKR82_05965 [Candidatus Acidoferrales bacterium]|nr:hypothetical protein [Candidatus Acidoferrales bacterium]